MRPRVPVVIVGAGPTGITAATLLAQYGIDSLVLDRWSDVYPAPRAVHLDDEVCRIIARLGIADEFSAISRPVLGLRLLDPAMRVLAELRRDTALGANGFPQANMFDQPGLEALLRANVKRYPSVRLRGDVEVVGISDTADGAVAVVFTDCDGTQHEVVADYVLGCDGANSLVRRQIGVGMRAMRFAQRWLVIDIATDADLDQWDGVHQVCDPVRAATFMRTGPDRYRWEFRLLDGESADDFATLRAMRPLLARWAAGVDDDDLDLIRVTEYTFRAQVADRWRCGNVFLLGDAAHLTPPFIGQGLGAGLRDAMNLAWKLAGVLTGDLPDEALNTYETERKPHVRHMIRLALAVGRAMTAGGEAGTMIRRVLVTRLASLPGLRRKLTDSRTPALHQSAFVRTSRAGRHLAGTLCPNPLLPGGARLDDVLGDGFAVISTQRLSSDQRSWVHARGAVDVCATTGSELADWLRRHRVTTAVVRPDRTVMCASRDVETVCAVLPYYRPHTRVGTRV